MAEEIKNLIEKIRREGIEEAEAQARKIQEEATKKAEEIISQATAEAQKIISRAKEEADKTVRNGKIALGQAARDLIISLKNEINALLQKIIVSHIQASLTAQELGRILSEIIKSPPKTQAEIVVSLNKEDFNKLQGHFLGVLKEEIKNGILLQVSDDIKAGFIISFDAGKSYFDFTDKALAEYIAARINPKLAELFKP
ncbi:MAG: hypothetical protein NC923_04005 [Candidatus Omnitrophica bacterium]|nr:hypothetical protein [Candidatus Omnitrophota bacterium]